MFIIGVSNCVGLRNYRYFISMVFSKCLLCIVIFAFSITHFVHVVKQIEGPSAFGLAISRYPGLVIVIIYSFVIGLNLCGLSLYHLYLISMNMTTHELIRYKMNFDPIRNHPYNRGSCIKNCTWVCCAPLQQTHDFVSEQV